MTILTVLVGNFRVSSVATSGVIYNCAARWRSVVICWRMGLQVNVNEGLRRTIDFWPKKLADSERATRATTV